jgi:hypothetical protein
MKKAILAILTIALCLSALTLMACTKKPSETTAEPGSGTTAAEPGSGTTADPGTGSTAPIGTAPVEPDADNMVIQGYIEDEYYAPVAGATVTVGGKTAATDATGFYTILAPRAGAFTASAAKEGYYAGSTIELTEAVLAANPGALNIKLVTKHYVSGKVTNGIDGKAAAGVRAYLETDKEYSVSVSADGTYMIEFAAVPFSEITVVFFEFKNSATAYKIIPIAGSAVKGAVIADMTVAPNTIISGKVMSGDTPVPGATIKIEPKIPLSGVSGQRTIETVLTTNDKGEYTTEGGFIMYTTEYTVFLEILDPTGSVTNNKGERVLQMSKTLTPTAESRSLTADFVIAEPSPEILGVPSGNFYSPHKTLTASVKIPEGKTATAYKWYIKTEGGSYPAAPSSTSQTFVYTPIDGKKGTVKLVVTAGGRDYTVESAEFKYNYVKLETLDPAAAGKFTIDENGNVTVANTVSENTASFFTNNNIMELPELYMNIVMTYGFRLEATFEFVSGAKVGSKEVFAGFMTTGLKDSAGGTGVPSRGSRQYPFAGVVYSTNQLNSGWAGGVKNTAYTGTQTTKIHVVMDYSFDPNFDIGAFNYATDGNVEHVAWVVASFYTEDGTLIGTTEAYPLNAHTVMGNGFNYPGLNFDNVACKVTDIAITAKEEEVIRRDQMKTLLEAPGASSLGEVYTEALALYSVTDTTVMNKVLTATTADRNKFEPFEFRDDFKAKLEALRAALG